MCLSGRDNIKLVIVVRTVLLVGAVTVAASLLSKSPEGAPESNVVREWMRSMTVREKAAQLVVMQFYGKAPNAGSEQYRRYLSLVRDLKIGGFGLINRSEPHALVAFLNRMQRAAKIPLLNAGDFERGMSMRVESDALFPHNMAFAATGSTEYSRIEGEITARQARALGVPWIFAPVADVNNNPDNPIINIRSYGENPEEVSAHVRAYIEGARKSAAGPVLVTVKHFPGHGDTATDSHMALPVIKAGRDRLETVELVPFRAAVASGVDAVMSAHIAVPAISGDNTPATLSPALLTGILQKELGFKGLVVTDALEMQGIAKQWSPGEAAVKALEAGTDILLMTPDPEAVVDAVVAAVNSGRISMERLDRSVAKFLEAKVRVGLDRNRFTDIEALLDSLDTPEDVKAVQEIADRAVTLVKNDNGVVPLRAAGSTCFVVLTEGRASQGGRAFVAEAGRRGRGAAMFTLDPQVSDADISGIVAKAKSCDAVAVAAFVSVASYRGNVALAGNYPKLMQALIQTGRPVVLVSLGNPYLVRGFPDVSAYMTTYSTVAPSEIAAAKALFGEIPIQGRLPVTIPGVAKYGEGIRIPAE